MIRSFVREITVAGFRTGLAIVAAGAAIASPVARTAHAEALACEQETAIDEAEVDAAIGAGRYHETDALTAAKLPTLDKCGAALLHAYVALERHDWASAIRVNPTDCGEDSNLLLWFARGLGAARAIGRSENLAALPAAREALTKLDEAADAAGPHSAVEVRRLALKAVIVASQDEREELKILLTHAAGLAERVSERCAVTIGELAGDLWLQVDRYEEARRAYAAALGRRPRRAQARLGLARAAMRLGDRVAAEESYRAFLDLWPTADADRPEIDEARKYIASRP